MITGKIKGFAKDSLLYGIGDGLGRLVSLIMLPILSRAFVPADYGAIDLLSISYYFLLMLVHLNARTGLQKFYYQSTGPEQRKLTTSVCFFLTLLAFGVATFFFVGADYLSTRLTGGDEISHAVRLLSLCLPIELFFNSLQLLLRLRRKAIFFSLINIINVIITPVLTYVWVVILESGITGVFISKLIALCILTAITFAYERNSFSLTVSFESFKMMFFYAIPGHPTLIIKSLMNMLPRFILSLFAPLSAVGLFGIAFRITQVLNIFVEAFNRSWNPFAFAHFEKPEEKTLYEIIFKFYALALILLSTAISIFAKEVLLILTPSQYHTASYLVGGIAFYLGVRGLALIFSTALYSANQVKWTSYLNVIQLIVFLIFALMLVPKYETTGLIISLDVAIAVYFFCYIKIIMKYFAFNMHLVRLFPLLLAAICSVVIFNFLELTIIYTLLTKLIFIIFFSTSSFLFIINNKEKEKLIELINSKKTGPLS